MNEPLFHVCFAMFLALPPFLLALRLLRPRAMPWSLVVMLIAVIGWGNANGAVHFYFAHLKELLALHPDATALAAELAKGGAKQDSAIRLGWLYGLVYALPWVATYGLVRVIGQQLRKIKSLPRS